MTTLGVVTLTAVAYPGVAVTSLMNADAPRVSGGIARWTQIQRPRRRDTLEFDSEDPVKLTFGVMLNAWPDGEVESTCRTLYGWAAINGLPDEPTVVHVAGPVPYPDINYVITKIDDSGEVQYRADGLRCRQELKLELTEYQTIDLISGPVAATTTPAAAVTATVSSTAATTNSSTGTYVVSRGDTLSSIAAKKLGNANKWHALATLNNIRDPRRLAVGQTLKLP